jgi:hypothetical protein
MSAAELMDRQPQLRNIVLSVKADLISARCPGRPPNPAGGFLVPLRRFLSLGTPPGGLDGRTSNHLTMIEDR